MLTKIKLLLIGVVFLAPSTASAQDPRISVDTTIEGTPTSDTGTYIIDTGASGTTMSRDLATDVGLLDSNGQPVAGEFELNPDGSLKKIKARMADGSFVYYYKTKPITLICTGTDDEVCDAEVPVLIKTDDVKRPDGSVSPGSNLLGMTWLLKVGVDISTKDKPPTAVWSHSEMLPADYVAMSAEDFVSAQSQGIYSGIQVSLGAGSGSYSSNQNAMVATSLPISMITSGLLDSLVANGASVSYSPYGVLSEELQLTIEMKGLGNMDVAPNYLIATISGLDVEFSGTGFGPSSWQNTSFDFIVNDEIDYVVLGMDFLAEYNFEFLSEINSYAAGWKEQEYPWSDLSYGGSVCVAEVLPDLRGVSATPNASTTTLTVDLHHSASNSQWVLRIGTQIDGITPFGNGVVVPTNDFSWLLGPTSAIGYDSQQVVIPHSSAVSGSTVYLQAFQSFSQHGGGITSSDAISVIIP